MFGLFAKKASFEDSNGEDMMMTPPIKIGGQEFMSGDTKSFDQWAAKAKANNDPVFTGEDGATYSASSKMGKAKIIEAELQVKYGISADSAAKAVKGIKELQVAGPPPTWVFKNKAATSEGNEPSTEPVAKKGSSESSGNFRSPRGAIAK